MEEASERPPAAEDFADVSAFLRPRSVAVIGASDQPGNVGGAAVRFFRKFGSPCAVYPINRRRESVADLPGYPSVAELPSQPDLAILAVPASAVAGIVRDCAAAGITAGIVWAGGFIEGDADGAARQEELIAVCRETGFAILGPNCLGVIETHTPIPASFASMMLSFDRLLPGNISMISQSGGLASIAHALAQQQGYGFRYSISTGNEAVLGVADFLSALVDDPLTKVIALYLEGARDGEKVRRALTAARDARKPVIVLKAGATGASAIAAAAHTGALAGEKRVWDAVLRECAAIRVDSLEELLDVALELSGADLSKLPSNRGVAVITFGGGSGVLSADQCDRAGLAVPSLSLETREALKEIVPPLASTRNPVDLTPQTYLDPTSLKSFPRVLDVIAGDPSVGAVLFQAGPMSRGDAELAEIDRRVPGALSKAGLGGLAACNRSCARCVSGGLDAPLSRIFARSPRDRPAGRLQRGPRFGLGATRGRDIRLVRVRASAGPWRSRHRGSMSRPVGARRDERRAGPTCAFAKRGCPNCQ